MKLHIQTNKDDSLLHKIKSETKIYTNINFILNKINQDGYFDTVADAFSSIFSKEMAFAISGNYNKNLKKLK